LHVASYIWLLDYDTNEHICSSIHCFSHFYAIQPVSVSLPNGQFLVGTQEGKVQFSPHLYIIIVLYSPNFKFKLIYVSILYQSLSCTV